MALLAPQTEGEIQTPRQYQTELFFEARKRNVIAYLDTGSGKTLVSVLLIKDKAGSLNENGHKRVTIFLAPKVLLVQQQADVLRKHTSLRVSHFCGDMNVDYWDRRRWGKELQEQDIWVMTPQILLNVLRHGFLKITDLNLLVCDECHRAIKKDPYNCIMQEFYHDRSTEGVRPHIFGMTASPVNTRAKQTQMKVAEAVWQLERNMDAQVITVIDRDPVTAAAPLPELKLLYYVRQHTSDSLKEVEAGLAAAIWTLHRGETVMAQLEAARAQQAAEAACIGLTLDEEKITSLSASTRRHLQGLAIVVQELGPWCAAAVLLELLRSKQVNNLMDPVGDIAADNRYTEEGPDSAAIRKTPGAYVPTPTAGDAAPGHTSQIKGTTPASQSTGKGQDAASQHQADTDMLGVFPVKKPAPVTPEVQALNVALREVAKMLTQALPLSKRRRLASAHALSQIDPAAHNFKVLLRHVVSRVMDAIPSKLLDQELGIKSAPDQNEEVGPEPQSAEAVQGEQAQQAEHAQQDAESTETQQAADPQHAKHDAGNDGDFEEEEQGRVRLPLFTNKVMTLVQDLLQYKDDVTASKLAAYSTMEEAAKRHWSAILFVTRKMTALGLDALFKSAPCLKAWRAATLVGYGGSLASSCLTSKAQHGVLQQMKGGELDIVISTAVAEEGLDVKQCQLVIRFDLPSTLLAFVQSRGRARAHGSHYVLMLERGNRDHELLLSQVVGYEANMRFHAKRRPGLGEEEVKEEERDVTLTEMDINHIPLEMREYRVASTEARVTLASAKPLLYMFCAKLPADRYTVLRPRFSTQVLGEDARLMGYQSSAILPNNSPVRIAQGQIQRTRALAQASASLEACKQLHQSGALDENLLPDVPTFELDPDDDSDEEILFAKAMPVTARKRRNAAAVAAAMIDMNGFQTVMSPAEAKAVQKQITIKPKIPEILKQPAEPDDKGVTTWLLYKFTITAKMGFMYHIPGPDEDPDDPKTNTCPLDPVLENKLNMLAALPKQIFGMLVPKELPDVRALMPYSLRLPHARDALDCKFDLVGPVRFSQDQMDEIKSFHAAMMEGPQKKKNPKKVAEELKKLTEAARKALGEDLPAPDSPPQPADSPTQTQPADSLIQTQPADSLTQTQPADLPTQTQPADPLTQTQPADSPTQTQPAHSLTQTQPIHSLTQTQPADSPTQTQPQASAEPASAEQRHAPDENAASLAASAAAAPAGPSEQEQVPTITCDPMVIDTAAASAALNTADGPAQTADPKSPDDPSRSSTAKQDEPAKPDELTKFKEGDENAEDGFVSKYFVLPLQQWMDWEDPNHTTDDSFPEVDWEAVRHVKSGWKPLSTLEEVQVPEQGPACSIGDAMDLDGDQPVPAAPAGHAGTAIGDEPMLCTSIDHQQQSQTLWQSICTIEFTVLEADQAIPDSGTVAYRIISSDASDPSKSTAAFTISDDSQAVISKGTAAFSLLAGDHSIPNGTGTASLEVHSVPSEISTESASAVGDGAVPGPGSSCLDAGDASLSAGLTSIPSTNGTVPSSNGIVPNSSMTGFKLGQLDPQRLKNSVVVTTYNSTPYFYEGTDPQLTPESKFPDDKLKLQLVVEEEEEDDFMKPPPSKETDAPTDKPAYQAEQSADKGGESTSVTAATAAAAATGAAAGSEEGGKEADDLAVRLIASKKASTFTEYFKTRWNQEGLDPGQPLLRVGLANRRRDTPYEGGVFLVPQLCIAHPLTRQCFIMSKLVHQVLHYVNNCLLTSELQPKLVKAPHRMPNIVYVLEALTPKACQEDYSYERFELLGDAFLKYAVSLFLFLKFPEAHEGQLAGRKGAVVANTNLVKIAIHNGLKYYMLAPLPRGKGARKRAELGLSTTQQLKSKAWADVVESLIGCIYLEAGEKAAMEFLVYLGIIPEVPIGFEREPTVHIAEVNMEDDQLAANIAAAESAAAALDLTEPAGSVQPGAEAAAPAGAADAAAAAPALSLSVTALDPAPASNGNATHAVQTDSIRNAVHVVAQEPAPNSASNSENHSGPHANGVAAGETAFFTNSSKGSDSMGGSQAEATKCAHDSFPAGDNQAMDTSAADQTTNGVPDAAAAGPRNSGHPFTTIQALNSLTPPPRTPTVSTQPGLANGHATDHPAVMPLLSSHQQLSKLATATPTQQGTAEAQQSALDNGPAGKDTLLPADAKVQQAQSADPDALDISADDSGSDHDNMQSGYMIQSGYGANSDAEDSDLAESRSANPEEIEIAEEEVEGDILLPPSPSQAAHPMELDPAPIGMLASSVPAGDGTIPEQARLGSNLSSRDDDDQVKMDAQAFLAMEEDSGDEHQARPSRGKVWRPPQELIDSYSSGIEAVLGYKFQKRALLQEALTHTSWPDATQQGYQRLEFLGDAVLDLLMTRYYFTTYRDSSPGTLSDLRSASVNNTRLASVAVLHKIHTFIRHCSSPLFHDIGLFVEQLQQAVADQEKKIIEQQQVLRQQQRLEAARAGEDVSMTDGKLGGMHKAGGEDLNDSPPKRPRSSSPDSHGRHLSSSSPDIAPETQMEIPSLDLTRLQDSTQPQSESAKPTSHAPQEASAGVNHLAAAGSAQQLPTELPNDSAAVNADSRVIQVNPSTADKTSAKTDSEAAAAAAAEAGGDVAGEGANPTGGIMDLEDGVQHPLGGPKPDKPKSKRKRHIYNKEAVRGKPRELQADDDAKAAALMWASEAAFGNTEVAAPKILGDIVESLVGAVYIDSHCNFDRTWQIFQPLMSPLLSPSTVPKHPIRHLHERAQQDGKLLKFVCSVSNPRSEGVSPMEEAEQKRKNGQIPAGITPEQAAEDARQVVERQKQWQQRWRERHERESALYDAVAVVEDVIIGRCIGATNKALAKRRAAEDALRIIAQKEAAVAAAAVAQQAAELQAALAVPGMESTAPVSPSASPPTEDAAAAAPAADVT